MHLSFIAYPEDHVHDVVQVMTILVSYLESKDWQMAVDAAIPQRKRAASQGADAGADEGHESGQASGAQSSKKARLDSDQLHTALLHATDEQEA